MSGVKGQDIVVLLKLASIREQAVAAGKRFPEGAPYSVRGLETLLGISKSEVNASIKRSLFSGLAVMDRETGLTKPHPRNLHDFIIHGLKFVFPAQLGAMTRGIPTAFAAPVLNGLLISGGEYIHIWPSADGNEIGQSVQPLFKSVPDAVQRDDRLYEYLALVDAIRIGNQRESGLAAKLLSEKLLNK